MASEEEEEAEAEEKAKAKTVKIASLAKKARKGTEQMFWCVVGGCL
jgi:hypothetical protein